MAETGYTRSDLRSLLELQRYDSEINRLRAAIARTRNDPEVEALRTRADETFGAAQAGKERVVKLKHAITWEEKEADDIRAEIAEAERKMYGGLVSNPKELDQMQKRVEQLRIDLGRHDEAGLAAMVEGEEAEPALAGLVRTQAEVEVLLAKIEGEQRVAVADLENQIKGLAPKRAEMATRVPEPLRVKYERIRDARSGVGAAAIRKDDLCGACLVEVPRALVKAVAGGRLETCESCGRLLIHLFEAAGAEVGAEGAPASSPAEGAPASSPTEGAPASSPTEGDPGSLGQPGGRR